MMRLMWIVAVSSCLVFGACGKDDKDKGGKDDKSDKGDKADKGKSGSSSGPVGGCDRREKEFVCGEYHGDMATKGWVKEQCDYQSVPTVDKCPTDGAIGRCVMFEGTASEVHEVWYAGGEAMLDACEKKNGVKKDP